MENEIVSGLFILFGIVILAGFVIVRKKEKCDWNKGFCGRCGHKWEYFDSTFCGDRGYQCPKCGRHIWISYNVDK